MSIFETLLRGGLLSAAIAVTATSGAAATSHAVNVSAGLTGQGAPLALRGYDPVAYFADGTPRLGSAEHSVAHDGATYRFASADHQRRFEQDPDRYLPAFGGFCAYGVSVGAKFDGDPLVWKIVDDRLYLNLNQQIQGLWNEDTSAAIRNATAAWPSIRQADPAALKPGG